MFGTSAAPPNGNANGNEAGSGGDETSHPWGAGGGGPSSGGGKGGSSANWQSSSSLSWLTNLRKGIMSGGERNKRIVRELDRWFGLSVVVPLMLAETDEKDCCVLGWLSLGLWSSVAPRVVSCLAFWFFVVRFWFGPTKKMAHRTRSAAGEVVEERPGRKLAAGW